MADERTTLDDLRTLIDRNHDDNARQFKAINDHVERQVNSINARVERLESRRDGHTDEQIVEMIDQRLEHFAANILPNVIRKAVHDELAVPLKTLEENTEELKKLAPLIKTVETGSNIRSALLWAVPLASAVVVIAAALTIAQAVAS